MLRISIVFFASLMLAAGFQPAAASPKYASIVVDAHSGRVLQYYRDEQNRYPASLTKIMTVYVAFEEIRAGRMKPDTPIKISRHAAAQPASKLGFRPGKTISARLALQALVVKSANDVATAMAEHISGSEAKFAKRMTRTARKLGMFDTNFVNASGLFNWRQKSSARDIARLAKAFFEDEAARLLGFPSFAAYDTLARRGQLQDGERGALLRGHDHHLRHGGDEDALNTTSRNATRHGGLGPLVSEFWAWESFFIVRTTMLHMRNASEDIVFCASLAFSDRARFPKCWR